jgi:hypothetical protein
MLPRRCPGPLFSLFAAGTLEVKLAAAGISLETSSKVDINFLRIMSAPPRGFRGKGTQIDVTWAVSPPAQWTVVGTVHHYIPCAKHAAREVSHIRNFPIPISKRSERITFEINGFQVGAQRQNLEPNVRSQPLTGPHVGPLAIR